MATIKPIEGRSVHQIQSGQVIVDLCSVVKELIENSLDAGATSIDIRFKNQGLDAIEVQDNGGGIAPEDFESVALKHHTSKLNSYDDLSGLTTFGFRGEALSSLCALAEFHVVTARASDGPKGTRLDFEVSGKLKNTSIVASTKGTIVSVANIFYNLPVRKRELEKHIKREYGKVLGVLHAYACISTGVKFSVSNQMPKGKKTTVFSTKANPTSKENIANVYGAKTLLALIPLDLKLEMQPGQGPTQSARNWGTQVDDPSRRVQVVGHISRPVVGEGRQTPDRQMFFVNSRPCGLPQVTKAANEVYKSYNVTQSPFIFANFIMDTNAYDVNVSPDKRTIMLHDQTLLLESLKASLVELFESHDQSVPQSQLLSARKLPPFRPLSVIPRDSTENYDIDSPVENIRDGLERADRDVSGTTKEILQENSSPGIEQPINAASLIHKFVGRNSETRNKIGNPIPEQNTILSETERLTKSWSAGRSHEVGRPQQPLSSSDNLPSTNDNDATPESAPRRVLDFNARIASQHAKQMMELPKSPSSPPSSDEEDIPAIKQRPTLSTPGPVQSAFDRMRPKRTPMETATITIGGETIETTVGSAPYKRRRIHTPKGQPGSRDTRSPLLFKSLREFAAPGARFPNSQDYDDEEVHNVASDTEDDTDLDHSRLTVASKDSLLASTARLHEDTQVSDDEVDPQPGSESEVNEAPNPNNDSDDEYIDESEKKAREEARVASLIAKAEQAMAKPTQDNLKRATKVLKGPTKKFSTLGLVQTIPIDFSNLQHVLLQIETTQQDLMKQALTREPSGEGLFVDSDAEEKLSLTVSKSDFHRMRILGQFNLGFILAMRPGGNTLADELFIIDQHASDEKYNFERLQQATILTPQRLVHPHPLCLTAIEEEIIDNNTQALVANGFQISIDTSGTLPVGRRCSLLTLPTSREVTFTPADLEELLVLLSERVGNEIPRPAKVRRLLAMRACRSSVMVGKTMTPSQMERIVRHMGELEKPWNCPHGRPTMRHLYGMARWEAWKEGDGLVGLGKERMETNWKAFMEG
ncbi:DNA mismatch repair protein MutL [Pseudovirgaria hyperparasitica]|uniref:DNA mismatch repair protein PMS1 n=1 Tax=Pseudovirgaria hyperparasitica TaxID=470096 RepID=A0A6A6WER6_9PEZI|nr:DNA mismatch repair protein MutL [Pseudovirgaria hyperparasitica]KAF2760649.1 DNA mismatch repair protein MutL [Pseudovirgaria hyperparasitica]